MTVKLRNCFTYKTVRGKQNEIMADSLIKWRYTVLYMYSTCSGSVFYILLSTTFKCLLLAKGQREYRVELVLQAVMNHY